MRLVHPAIFDVRYTQIEIRASCPKPDQCKYGMKVLIDRIVDVTFPYVHGL